MTLRLFAILLMAGSLALVAGCMGDNEREEATPVPVATNTSTPAPTDTVAPPSTPTSTNTPPPTNTPSITPTPTITPTGPRPTVPPLGERLFTIAPPSGGLGTPPNATRTGLFSTGLAGANVATTFAAQDFTLIGGSPDGNGVASLTLAEDFVFAVGNPLNVVCFRVRAAGSSGEIDCDGGTAYGVRLSQETGADAPPATLEEGVGGDTGAGGAILRVMQESVQMPAGTTLEQCLTAPYDPAVETVYTTGTATAIKGAKTIELAGENFDCDTFADTDSFGMLVNPSVASNPAAGGDVSNILRLADNAAAPQ